jgi:hypothetical protein
LFWISNNEDTKTKEDFTENKTKETMQNWKPNESKFAHDENVCNENIEEICEK